jgi:aminocarboxymuconate-semialdehyde decarboxylase
MQNEQLAAVCATYPDRLVGLATVALQHPDLAAQQLEFGVTKLGLRGVSLGASVNDEELASPRFEPFWAEAERLDVPVFIHPQGAPALSSRLQGNGVLTNVIGNPLDTTIALSHLIFEGTLDRFPGLKICAAHGGGYLPAYADRSDHGCLTFPEQCNRTLRKRPTEYLRQLYFDSLVFSGEALRHLIAVSGVSQLVLGTDYPFPWTSTAVDHVLDAPELSDADRVAILGGNAARLLKISA